MESHESESKHSSKEKQMSIGRKKFNMDPKKGKWMSNKWKLVLSFQRETIYEERDFLREENLYDLESWSFLFNMEVINFVFISFSAR